VRPDAWETPVMKKYVADFPPAAVARDQLKYSVAELSTHENQRVTKALPAIMRSVVVLPQPEGPSSETNSRLCARNENIVKDHRGINPTFLRHFTEWRTRDLSSHIKGLYDQAAADGYPKWK
jgi:hypothetical protein